MASVQDQGDGRTRFLAAQASFLRSAAACPARQSLVEQAIRDARQQAELVWTRRRDTETESSGKPVEVATSSVAAVPAKKFIPHIPRPAKRCSAPSKVHVLGLGHLGHANKAAERGQDAHSQGSTEETNRRSRDREKGKRKRSNDREVISCAATISPAGQGASHKERAFGCGIKRQRVENQNRGMQKSRKGGAWQVLGGAGRVAGDMRSGDKAGRREFQAQGGDSGGNQENETAGGEGGRKGWSKSSAGCEAIQATQVSEKPAKRAGKRKRRLERNERRRLERDCKSRLNVLMMRKWKPAPEAPKLVLYTSIPSSSPEAFCARVELVPLQRFFEGSERATKNEAEQSAAEEAMAFLESQEDAAAPAGAS